nr:keratin, type II cytoskeletal 8-like [Anolis sagrei ordinatus]
MFWKGDSAGGERWSLWLSLVLNRSFSPGGGAFPALSLGTSSMSLAYPRAGSLSFSSRSQGSLPNRSSWYRASPGAFPPGLFRGAGAGGASLSASPAFLISSLPSLEIDPKLHQIRTEEKEQIKGLNNQFASFIDKVRKLEQQNKALETQLRLLKSKDQYKSNVGRIMTAHSQPLKQQIDVLNQDKVKLQNELDHTQALLEELKSRYEDEINRRNQLENEFVITKKDLDDIYLQKVDVESKVEGISNEIKYLKQLFEEEIRELQSQIQNAMVTVEMDNNRELEMKHIIDEVKEQYKAMAVKSREDAEQWYKNKFDDMARQTQKHHEELKGTKGQIAELTRYAQRINGEIEALKNQRANLENAVAVAEEQGEHAVQNAKASIQDLEEALRRAKHDMAGKVRDYQELMNIKLALDIEIATYRKLLEGEENRMAVQTPSNQYSAIDKLDF